MVKHITLAEYEALESEWHPTKNGELFRNVIPGSSTLVWWKGSCGHEWETKMFARAVRGAGCPVCSNRELLTGFNDIATVHPDWVREWSSTNLPVTPDAVIAGGRKEWAWICDKGHEYFSSVFQKAHGRNCPVCSNQKTISGVNDLATLYPELAAQWHPTKNGDKSPETVVAGGRTSYWWKGACGHEWETTVRRRVSGTGCPVCVGLKVVEGVNDLLSQRPDLAAQWHPTKNKMLTPETIYTNSGTSVWWQCDRGHEWQQKVSARNTDGRKCAECKKETDLHPNSQGSLDQVNPEVAAQWHPTKNLPRKTHTTSAKTSYPAHWVCDKGHEWQSSVYGRVTHKQGCPVCAGKKPDVGVNDLATLHPALASQWHPTKNGDLTPDQLLPQSNNPVWWVCEKGHDYLVAPYKRFIGRGCPVCSGHQVISGVNDLATLHPDLTTQWHPTKNGDVTPQQVTGGGGRSRAWWQCDKGHEWEARVADRIRGRGCPECWAGSYASKAETELVEFIRYLLPGEVVVQGDRKTLQGKEVDVYVPSHKLGVEFNGLFWHTEESGRGRRYHEGKYLAAKHAGIQLLQVWEDDYNRNPDLVKRVLAHKLGVSDQPVVYARKTRTEALTTAMVRGFLDQNHIQGFASGSYYLGLRDIETQGLVAVMVLKREVGVNVPDGTLNIIRYATSTRVPGGFTKLLKYAENAYNPTRFITFADHCVSDGGLYEGNGFVADKILPPDYMYVVNGERAHKFGYRIRKFRDDPVLDYVEGYTEKQLAALNGFERVWDAGKTRYVKQVG